MAAPTAPDAKTSTTTAIAAIAHCTPVRRRDV
jgi:hypothetical protein